MIDKDKINSIIDDIIAETHKEEEDKTLLPSNENQNNLIASPLLIGTALEHIATTVISQPYGLSEYHSFIDVVFIKDCTRYSGLISNLAIKFLRSTLMIRMVDVQTQINFSNYTDPRYNIELRVSYPNHYYIENAVLINYIKTNQVSTDTYSYNELIFQFERSH